MEFVPVPKAVDKVVYWDVVKRVLKARLYSGAVSMFTFKFFPPNYHIGINLQ